MEKDGKHTDLMRYDLRLQEALRGAVRTIMNDIARSGFPGDHHFYVSFRTTARGVQMSPRLRTQYPDEMTIVLQYQFWDLVVTDREFSVGLSFQQIPEKLVIPFDSITSFVDPSVQFVLKFEVEGAPEEAQKPALQNVRPRAPQPVHDESRDEPLQDKTRLPRRLTPKVTPVETHPKASSKNPPAAAPAAPPETKKKSGESGKIVSIDAFRKKP